MENAFLTPLTILFLLFTLAQGDDLLEQYVQHVGRVNNYHPKHKPKTYFRKLLSHKENKKFDSSRSFIENSTVSSAGNLRTEKTITKAPKFSIAKSETKIWQYVRDNNKQRERRKRQAINSDTVWTHSQVLSEEVDGNGAVEVVLRWQPRHQEILFRVEARTKGYVGIGFSPDGGMERADIVMGWVDDRTGKAFLMDCHGVPKSAGSAPVRDEIDNYTLMRALQNDTHTVIEFRRVLDTCDPNDYVLNADTVRVIWALHDIDPQHGAEMVYHGSRRGVQSLHLLGPSPVQRQITNSRQWDVTLKNFKLENDMKTVYWCKIFKAPTLNTKHHIIGFEPLIAAAHRHMVHHMIMHECELDPNNANLPMWDAFAKDEGRLCYSDMPYEWERCLTPLVAWAVGSHGEYFPNNVGLPLGGGRKTTGGGAGGGSGGSVAFYMLEVHFDNPSMRTAVGTSGLRLHYTNELRPNEGGILITGVAPSTLHFIPPYQNEYKTAGYCSLGCTKEVFPKDGINVVSVMLHSHLAGRKLRLRHIRAGKELPPLAVDNHYDFNYQQSRALSEHVTILPGDGLITECTYSTRNRSRPTLGGYSTVEEMCLAFVLHYPRTELAGCYSLPPVRYFFENLGVREFYDRNMTEIERILLEGADAGAEALQPLSASTTTTTVKPFEVRPGDEMSPEANLRAINALIHAKEYSIEGAVSGSGNIFDQLVIKEPAEFRNKTFTMHLQNIPYNETILTKKIEEYFYIGLHLTFCRKRDDSLAIKENIEKLPTFAPYDDRENNIQCSHKSRHFFSNGASSGGYQNAHHGRSVILSIIILILFSF